MEGLGSFHILLHSYPVIVLSFEEVGSGRVGELVSRRISNCGPKPTWDPNTNNFKNKLNNSSEFLPVSCSTCPR